VRGEATVSSGTLIPPWPVRVLVATKPVDLRNYAESAFSRLETMLDFNSLAVRRLPSSA
jgi:hypothetical protein